MNTTADPLFQLRQVGLSYRAHPVLRGIDWGWEIGDHWAIVAPNGGGKTSLARILNGEQQHFSGAYERGPVLESQGCAYVCFEHGRRLMDRDRKLDCSEYSSDARDSGTTISDLMPARDTDPDSYDRVVEMLNLESLLGRGIRYVSTGEMRKGLLAGAILSHPGLMILDNPMDGLDIATQERFGEVLDLIIEASTATLVLCRDPAEVPATCNKVLALDRGRIVAQGPREEVLASSELKELMGATPLKLQIPKPREKRRVRQTPTIELHNVSASWGDFCVLRDVNWRFGPNDHALIAGPNGCGKSTLLDLLTGDNHKAFGQEVYLFGSKRGSGESVWDIKSRFGRIDAKMQFAVPAGSSVRDVVVSGFFDSVGLHDRPSDQQRRTAAEWIDALALSEWATDEFQSLSFGLQRVALLARAMVKSPQILLLDEATLSLDRSHREMLLDAVDQVAAAGLCQLLFVSHTVGERPACINQVLQFTPHPDGSTVEVSRL